MANRRRVHDVRPVVRDRQLLDSRRVVDEERPRPVRTAVGAAKHAAVAALHVDVALGGDEHRVLSARVHDDAGDLLGLLEPDERPRHACIGALVHAAACGEAAAGDEIAGADVDRVAVRRRHFQGADHFGVLHVVHDRPPGGAGVGGLPHAAGGQADVERARLADHAGDGGDAPGAERTDIAPDERGEQLGSDGGTRRRDGEGADGEGGKRHRAFRMHHDARCDEV